MKVWRMFVWEVISQLESKNRDMPTTTKKRRTSRLRLKERHDTIFKGNILVLVWSMQLMRKFEEKAGQLFMECRKLKGFAIYIGTGSLCFWCGKRFKEGR